MKALCLRDCVREPVVNGKPIRFFYRMGRVYEIDPEASWAVWFRFPLTEEEVARIEEVDRSASKQPEYLESKKSQLEDPDDPFKHFNLKF